MPIFEAIVIILFFMIIVFLWEITCILQKLVPKVIPTGGTIRQIGATMPGAGSNSMNVGGTGTFQVTPTPAGSKVPAADQIVFSTPDTSVTLSPSSDGDPTKVVATDAASDTNPSFTLNCQFTGPDFPTPVVCTPLTVALIPASTLPTGGTIAQIA